MSHLLLKGMPLTEERIKTLKVIGIITIVFSILFLFVLIIYFQLPSGSYPEGVRKPNIYLYSNTEIEDTIRIDVIDGKVVQSDPIAHKQDYVEWKVTVNPNGLFYGNARVPWLFYETAMKSRAEVVNNGWYFEKSGETIKYNNNSYPSANFPTIFMNELMRIGLFEKEARDFIEYWFSSENYLFPKDARYILRLADNNWIESHLVLSTHHTYETLRIFLVLDQVDEPVILPIIPSVSPNSNATLVLHEWGVIIHQD